VTKPTAKHAPKENGRTVIGQHAAAAIRLLILTGARLREILHLRWEHVDLERGLLFLPDSKTGKKAIVLNAPAMAVLASLPRIGVYVKAARRPQQAVACRAEAGGTRWRAHSRFAAHAREHWRRRRPRASDYW